MLNNNNNFDYLGKESKFLEIDQYGIVIEITITNDGKTLHRQL